MSIIKSVVDTLTSKIATEEPEPTFKTSSGDYTVTKKGADGTPVSGAAGSTTAGVLRRFAA